MQPIPDFSEGPLRRLARIALGVAYQLKPDRITGLPALGLAVGREFLRGGTAVPGSATLHGSPANFGGVAFGPSPEAVMQAARAGFYPHAHMGPLKWLSPPTRAVMLLTNVHFAKRFRRSLKTTDLRVTFDQDFAGVMKACAGKREGRPQLTWITPSVMRLYYQLHGLGIAHSVEVWSEGMLVGGLFGVAVGPVFSALSMFHTADNASKIGIASLYHHLAKWGFTAVDHQTLSPWVQTLGAVEVPREDYVAMLGQPGCPASQPGKWSAELSLRETAEWEPAQPEHALAS